MIRLREATARQVVESKAKLAAASGGLSLRRRHDEIQVKDPTTELTTEIEPTQLYIHKLNADSD